MANFEAPLKSEHRLNILSRRERERTLAKTREAHEPEIDLMISYVGIDSVPCSIEEIVHRRGSAPRRWRMWSEITCRPLHGHRSNCYRRLRLRRLNASRLPKPAKKPSVIETLVRSRHYTVNTHVLAELFHWQFLSYCIYGMYPTSNSS